MNERDNISPLIVVGIVIAVTIYIVYALIGK